MKICTSVILLRTVVLVLAIISSSSALAAQGGRYADYLVSLKVDPAGTAVYLRGVADALATMNASIEHIEQRAPSFCPPPMLRLSDADNDRLMRNFMAKHADLDPKAVSLSSVLFLSYKERFPCNRTN